MSRGGGCLCARCCRLFYHGDFLGQRPSSKQKGGLFNDQGYSQEQEQSSNQLTGCTSHASVSCDPDDTFPSPLPGFRGALGVCLLTAHASCFSSPPTMTNARHPFSTSPSTSSMPSLPATAFPSRRAVLLGSTAALVLRPSAAPALSVAERDSLYEKAKVRVFLRDPSPVSPFLPPLSRAVLPCLSSSLNIRTHCSCGLLSMHSACLW